MAYMPSAREISVNMSRLAGPATGRWYDPTSGTYRMIAGSPWRIRGFGSSPAG
jgi:Putative collagen-binding domain of a collagenase